MIIALTILAELFFVTFLIIWFYRLKPKFGLVPLFVLIGSNQFFQTILTSTFYVTLFGQFTISPGATILFCASLFTILLIYIKEGVFITQRLIVGILLANFTFTILSWLTNQQVIAMNDIAVTASAPVALFKTNFRVFVVGTIVLLLDALIIVILYEYFFVKQKWLTLYGRLLLTMLLVFNFDAVGFTLGSFWEKPGFESRLMSQIFAKSTAAVFFASILWFYLRYLDKDKNKDNLNEEYGKEDIFSILTYRSKYQRLMTETAINEEHLQKAIVFKTEELEKSVRRFTILSSVRELRMDKFSSTEQANEFLIKVKDAFEADACSIHQLHKEELVLLANVGIIEAEKLLPHSNHFFERIIKTKKCQVIEDARKNESAIANSRDSSEPFQYISCAGTPMLAGDTVMGVLVLYFVHEKKVFTTLEIEHLQLIASQIAHIQENALLFEQNEKHKEVLVKQIVARKQAEKDIIREKELSDSLINSLPGVFYLYNEEGKFFRWNKNFEDVTGFNSEEMIDKHPLDFFVGRDKNILENKIKNVFKTGEDNVAAFFMDRWGSKTPYFFTGKVINYEGIRCLMGVGIDISERANAEEALTKSEERFRTLVEQASDGIFISNASYQFVHVNKSGCKMLGYQSEELLKMNILDIIIINENDPPLRFSELKEGKSVIQERVMKHKNGSLITVEISSKMMFNGDLLAFVRDISERKKYQETLEKSEQDLRQVLTSITDIFYVIDRNYQITQMNKTANELLTKAWGVQVAIGKNILELVPSDSDEPIQESFEKVFSGASVEYERYQNSPEIEGWYLVNFHPVISDQKKIIGAYVVTKDITERKKIEEFIRQSNERFELIGKAANDALWEWNLETNELWGNEAHQQLYGLTLTDPVPGDEEWRSNIHKDDKERILTSLTKTYSSDKNIWDGEYQLHTVNKGLVNIYGRTYIERNANGKPIRLLGSMMDITERKESERRVLKEKELSDSIINSLPGVFYLFDDTPRFLRWNKSFETITGYNADELATIVPMNLFDDDDKPIMKNQIEKAIKAGHANAETKLLTKTGDKIPFFFTGVSIIYEGKNCILGNGVDISERKRSEEEILEINKQLRNLSAHLQNIREEERKRIGREIHDDLGQQLTAIKMDVAWIDKNIPAEEVPIKGKLKNIIGLLDGSNQSVRRILNELKPSILDEYGLLDAMEWHAKQFTENTRIPVVFNTPEDAIKLEEDIATCIFRVFQESLTNVARHSEAKKVLVSVALISDRIAVSIADDGKGFEFASVQNKGSFGLLGISERVRAVNGIMDLNSVVEEGTTINISIPIRNKN